MKTLQLTPSTVETLATLAYAAWTEAYDTWKLVQAEKNDGTPDWDELHAHRLGQTKQEMDHANSVFNEIRAYSVLGKW